MTLLSELGEVATVAQLVGADVAGLITVIMEAAQTARQNRRECKQLARRVLIIARLLPLVQDPEAAGQMAGLGDTLGEAHQLLQSCQGRSAAYHFFMAGRKAARFREMQNKMEFYLLLFPVISHIGFARRLDRICNLLDSTGAGDEPSTLAQSSELQECTVVAQEEEVPYETHEFTFAEIVAATDYFVNDTLLKPSYPSAVTVYRGRLKDGREVVVKRLMNSMEHSMEEEMFRTELNILPGLGHKHIVRLLGSCVTASKKDKRLLKTPQENKKRLLFWWRKKQEEPEFLIVYEYLEKRTLFGLLHRREGSSELSPVTVSWKTRIDVLLGVSRAIEHMHHHASPRIIHRNIKSNNILFDASWVPRLSGFGQAVVWDMATEETELYPHTVGYLDPEYFRTALLKPTSDVYSLGVVMLEVLTGEEAIVTTRDEGRMSLASFAPPIIDAGNIKDLLDTRPMPKPTPGQLEALEHVAKTARCCVKEEGKDRPAISEIVASLEKALELICKDEPSSVHESPEHAVDVPWAVFPSQQESSEITLAEDSPSDGGHAKCGSDPGGSCSNSIDGTHHFKTTNSI